MTFITDAQLIANDESKVDEAMDLVYDIADDMLCNGEFEELDEIIGSVCASGLSIDIMLTILTITAAAKSKLPSREKFFNECCKILLRKGHNVDLLLKGLE